MIVTFGGGVGAGKFLEGLYKVTKKKDNLHIVVNTADDINIYGVRVSPDIDSVLYWLSGKIDKKKGWGIKDDTFNHIKKFAIEDSWFGLGDKDFKENKKKFSMMKRGLALQKVVDNQRKKLKITKARILPMTNEIVETCIKTKNKEMHFQEYLIKFKMMPRVEKIIFKNIRKAKPSNNLIKSISKASLIIFCPSNPIISIDPILSVPGVKEAVKKSRAIKVAISPIVDSKAFQGPVLKVMRAKGLKPNVLGVSKFYQGTVDYMMIDDLDKKYAKRVFSMGMTPLIRNIRMTDLKISQSMAESIINLV